jgi:hypothetical protein
MNWETEHYHSVLKITVSFMGIHKYIGPGPSLAVKEAFMFTVEQNVRFLY